MSRSTEFLDWDAPSHSIHGDSSPSNKELMARKDAKAEARDKALNTPMKPVTFSKTPAPAGNEYRLTSYGDD
jgi:hypothetical protein